jgi:hypothetical protein
MKRIGLVVAAAVAALVLGSVLASSGGAQAPGERTFKLISREGSEGFVDNPPRSRNERISAGDVFVFSQRTFTEAGARAGSIYVHCVSITTGRNPTFHCDGTYRLTDGSMTVSAAFKGSEGGNLTIAVTGGTGAYEGAEGSITTRELSGNRTEDTVHLLP